MVQEKQKDISVRNMTLGEVFNSVDSKMREHGYIPEGVMSIPHDTTKQSFDIPKSVDECCGRIVRNWDQMYLEIFVHGHLTGSDRHDYYEVGFYWIHKNDRETYKLLTEMMVNFVYLFDEIILGKEN